MIKYKTRNSQLAKPTQKQKKGNTKIPVLYGYFFLFSKLQNLAAKPFKNNNNEKHLQY